MKQHSVPKFLDNFLTRTLSGTVFSWREILQLTFPNVLDCLSIMFISMLITALISSNGEASVAAVSLVTPLAWMITCIFNGISAGGTVVVAQSCGMKDPVRIRKAAGMTLWLTVAVGTVVCLPQCVSPCPSVASTRQRFCPAAGAVQWLRRVRDPAVFLESAGKNDLRADIHLR